MDRRKLISSVVIFLLIIIVLTACNKETETTSRIYAISEDLQIELTRDGEVVAHGSDADKYDFSGWKHVTNLSYSWRSLFGVKTDGSVIALDLIDNEMINLEHLSNVVDVESLFFDIFFTLDSDGNVNVYNLNGDVPEEYKEAEKWDDILSIDTAFVSVAGVKSDGKVCGINLSEDMNNLIKSWRRIDYVSCSSFQIIGITKSGRVLNASQLSSENRGYTTPYEGLSGAKKVCLGHLKIAAIMKDGTFEIRSTGTYYPDDDLDLNENVDVTEVIKHMLSFDKPLSRKEMKEIYEYQQQALPEEIKALNGREDVVDFDINENVIAVLLEDGSVIVVGSND